MIEPAIWIVFSSILLLPAINKITKKINNSLNFITF